MDTERQIRYSNLGDSYWWNCGKYKVVTGLLKKIIGQYQIGRNNKIKILDIGCGPGNFIDKLYGLGTIFGLDVSLKALTICCDRHREKSLPLINAEADEIPLVSESIDIAILTDVLEHIRDDEKAINEIHRILRPGGMVLITAPAYQILWGSHDEIYQHYRRYRPGEMKHKIEKSGFTIEKLTTFEAIFSLPLLLFRKFKIILNIRNRDDFIRIPYFLNYILTRIILFEGWFTAKINYPFGVSIICIARK